MLIIKLQKRSQTQNESESRLNFTYIYRQQFSLNLVNISRTHIKHLKKRISAGVGHFAVSRPLTVIIQLISEILVARDDPEMAACDRAEPSHQLCQHLA